MIRHSDILLRLSCKVLVWVLVAGITTDFVVSKTVTNLPKEGTEPCIGENCGQQEDKLDQGQPAREPVYQMEQPDGNEKQEVVTDEPGSLNIDPDSLLHPGGGGHVHDKAPHVDAEAHEFGAAAPDIAKELHGAEADVHLGLGSGEVPNLEDPGPDMEAMLHEGLRHVHSTGAIENPSQAIEQDGVIGVDPESMLHGETDPHNHGGSDQRESKSNEGNFNIGADIDAMLHDGEQHVHSPNRKREQERDAIPEVPIGASDPEALLHEGNGHVHAHGGASKRHDPEPRPYGAADPEQMLHGSNEKHVHTLRQAMDGSRPLSGAKDPDVVGIDVKPADIRIGTLHPEDTADYHRWKSEKDKQAEDPSRSSSWLSGFSYVKDALLRDLEIVRKRYLGRIFGETEEGESSGEGNSKLKHDEA